MLPNPIQYVADNNPLEDHLARVALRRIWEHVDRFTFTNVLEIGCGGGGGTEELLLLAQPLVLDAIDISNSKVARASWRLRGDSRAILHRADATSLPFEAESYDLVVQIGAMHHMADWQKALGEVHRVLRPDGRFVYVDLAVEFFMEIPLLSPILTRTLRHRFSKMFNMQEYDEACTAAGFESIYRNRWLVPGVHEGLLAKVSK